MILMILTSHRADCFALCVDCLERHTDLRLFERVYVMANALEPEHFALARAFAARHGNIKLVAVNPRGLMPVMEAQNAVLGMHKDSVLVKLDEDVFVTEGWLEGLVGTYTSSGKDGCVLVSALVPNNAMGKLMLDEAFRRDCPGYADDEALHRDKVSANSRYAVWLWEHVLDGTLRFTPDALLRGIGPQRVSRYLNINCILADPRMLDCALPFGLIATDEKMPSMVTDEYKMNMVMQHETAPFYGLVTPDSLAHHFSFGPQQEALDACFSINDIRKKLLA